MVIHPVPSKFKRGDRARRRIPRARLAFLARRIYALGERPLFELLLDLQNGAPFHLQLELYAALPADFIREQGGDRLPPIAWPIKGGRE